MFDCSEIIYAVARIFYIKMEPLPEINLTLKLFHLNVEPPLYT